MEKKTTLYQKHLDAGGKMVPFAGYLLPVQYGGGVIAEHKAVRTAAGLFDVSHMGEVLVYGEAAAIFLDKLLTNRMGDMPVGSCRYSPMCNEEGGVIDDLIVYRLAEEKFMLVVNAANHPKDVACMQRQLLPGCTLEDISEKTAEIALQGPCSKAILQLVAPAATLPEKYYTFYENVQVAGVNCLVSRTGYTGEDGFELYCNAKEAPRLWDALLTAGKPMGLVPCGLGARDTLRLEAGMPLYGHEMNEQITPQEAGLGVFVKQEKTDFIGKQALAAKALPSRQRTGLRITGRGIAREGADVYIGNEKIGVVTSGTQLPFLGYAGAMALLDTQHREEGTQVEVDVRGRHIAAQVVKLPFYRRKK